MTQRVGVEFSGSAAGAVTASRQVSAGIRSVRTEAAGASPHLRTLENDLGKTTRGALAGSGAFRGLGRSVAFASGAFLGAAGFVAVIKSSIDVVLAAQTGIAKLDQAIVNAHASVKALTPIMEAHAAAARLLGFNDDQTREAEAKLVTAFGATKKSLGEVSVAADLARASNIPLADATRQLILLQEGNMRAAKQFGLALPDLTTKQWAQKAAVDGLTLAQEKGKTLYDELLPRIHAQAAAYAASPAGKIAEFHAEVQHLQESIGQGLLPVVDKYLTSVDAWLAKSSNQKKLTDDVKKVVGELSSALHDAKAATEDVLKVVTPVVHALGGWKTVIEDLIALKFASVIAGWAKPILAASGAAGGLLGRLRALSLSPWTIAIALSFVHPTSKGQSALDKAGIGFLGHIPILGPALQQEAALEAKLFGGSWGTGGATQKPVQVGKAGSKTGTAVASYAKQYGVGSGITYHWAGVSPMTGFDCSGYIYSAYASAGVKIPRDTRGQWNDPNAVQVPPGSERPGDGVYFEGDRTGKNAGPPPGHVGIYLGGGIYIEYFSEGKPAATANLANAAGYMGARRWLKIATTDSGTYGPDPPKTHTTTTTTTKAKKTPWVGATQGAINTALGSVAATLKGLPAILDPVEASAVSHIDALRKKLVPHMTAADKATITVELTKWGKVLHDEITKNAAGAKAALKQGLAEATALGNWASTMGDFKANLRGQFAQTLGVPQTYATPQALAAAEAGAEAINKRIAAGFYKNATTLKAATDQRDLLLKTIEDGLNGLEAAVTAAKVPYESAWAKLASAGDTAFGTQTQKTLTAMQQATAQALAGFVVAQTAAEKALADFQAGKASTQTPAEQALAAFDVAKATTAEAKQRADIAAQIADTQTQLDALVATPDTTAGGGSLIDISTGIRSTLAGNTVAGNDIVSQRKSLLDQLASLQDQSAQLDQQDQRAALQAAADASRTAADQQQTALEASLQAAADASRVAQDAQTAAAQAAYQAQADAAQTAYTDQRTLLQAAMDDQAGIIEASFEAGNITAATAFDELKKLYGDNGIDLTSLSVDIAGVIYTGVAAWTAPIMGLMDDLMAKVAAAKAALGATSAPDTGSSNLFGTQDPGIAAWLGTAATAAAASIPDALSRYLSGGSTSRAFTAFAAGGRVPGRFVGRDSVPALLAPGETVLDRKLTRALEQMVTAGGGGGPSHVVTILKINDREFARATAPALSAEQARAMGYTLQRG